MTSQYEHTNRQRPLQQAQGHIWPILALLLVSMIVACGGESGTNQGSDPSTETPAWEETVEFSVVWKEHYIKSGSETHLVEIPVEKCELVHFHLTASDQVELSYDDPADGIGGLWGVTEDLDPTKKAEATGTWTLEVTRAYGKTTPADVTVSWLVAPPRSEC